MIFRKQKVWIWFFSEVRGRQIPVEGYAGEKQLCLVPPWRCAQRLCHVTVELGSLASTDSHKLALCRNSPVWLQRRVSQFTNLNTDGSELCCWGLGFAVYFQAGLPLGATLPSLLGLPGHDALPRWQRCLQGAASFAGPIVFLSDIQRQATGGTSLWYFQSSIRYRSSSPEMACALKESRRIFQ